MEVVRTKPTPENWPAHIIYIRHNVEASELDVPEEDGPESVPGLSHLTVIQPLPFGHAARQGEETSYGLFARNLIPAGTAIGEFVGVLEYEGLQNRSRYKLTLSDNTDIDAKKAGNETRFINDYDGVAAEPNVYYSIDYEHRIAMVIAQKDIAKGEELLVDYGKESYWQRLKETIKPELEESEYQEPPPSPATPKAPTKMTPRQLRKRPSNLHTKIRGIDDLIRLKILTTQDKLKCSACSTKGHITPLGWISAPPPNDSFATLEEWFKSHSPSCPATKTHPAQSCWTTVMFKDKPLQEWRKDAIEIQKKRNEAQQLIERHKTRKRRADAAPQMKKKPAKKTKRQQKASLDPVSGGGAAAEQQSPHSDNKHRRPLAACEDVYGGDNMSTQEYPESGRREKENEDDATQPRSQPSADSDSVAGDDTTPRHFRDGASTTAKLKGLVIVQHGFDKADRKEIKNLAQRLKATYSSALKFNHTTHLIYTGSANDGSYQSAVSWDVKVVTKNWLIDSVKYGSPRDEAQYHPFPPTNEENEKEKEKEPTTTRAGSHVQQQPHGRAEGSKQGRTQAARGPKKRMLHGGEPEKHSETHNALPGKTLMDLLRTGPHHDLWEKEPGTLLEWEVMLVLQRLHEVQGAVLQAYENSRERTESEEEI